MAHFAKLDDNGVVQTITVVKNDVILDGEGNESEAIGNEFLNSIGMTGTWVQCSYNASFRGIYPNPGCWFDEPNDRFLSGPAPFPSWTYDDTAAQWNPPVPRPESESDYFWDESAGEWVVVPDETE